MSLTDEIYRELMDGLENNLDWSQFIAKYSASKGPLYNAIGRFFTEVGPKIVALKEEGSRVQAKLDAAGLTLDHLYRQIKEAEASLAPLEEEKNVLNEGVETLESKLAEKSGLVKHLEDLEKLGFGSERLRQLEEVLKEIGMRHGLNSKETVSKFFDDLKDYDLVLEAEVQLKGLQTQIETKKLEAENWQAKEKALRREYYNLKEAIEAVHTFFNRGVKLRQIIAWHQILTRFQTAEQFAECLTQYGNMTKLLKARKEEAENWELRLANAQGQVGILKKEKAEIVGAIEALKEAGVKQLNTLANREMNEIRAVGQKGEEVFSDFFARFDALAEKVFDVGQEYERTRQELRRYEGVRDVLESHAAALEAENELPE